MPFDDFAFESSDSDGGEYGAIVRAVVVLVVVILVVCHDDDGDARGGRGNNAAAAAADDDDDDEPTRRAARGLAAGIVNAPIDASRAGRIQRTRIMAKFVDGAWHIMK